MTEPPAGVVASHERFLEYQNRRRGRDAVARAIAAERAPGIDPHAPPETAPVPTPDAGSQT